MNDNMIKRAVILAAGVGKRMQPVTFTTPKPLVKVNGKCMIDTVVEALLYNGINEIYVVVGYLKDRFIEWNKKYPNIILIDNPYYETCNNISSLYVARSHLEDCIILDGDQIINNKSIIYPYFDKSGYNVIWRENFTNEWMLETEDDIIKKCHRNGGYHAWQLYSVSRWNKEDGIRLKEHLENEFVNKGNTDIYWDDLAIFCYPNEYNLGIYPMKDGDVVEIDSLAELVEIDSTYNTYLKGEINENFKQKD